MEIRRKRCSAADGMLTRTVKIDIFITISHLFVSRPTLEFTKFEQQMCSTTQMHCHWEQTAAKKWNMATFNSVHQAKKHCNFDSGWLEQQQGGTHSFL